MKLLSDLEQRVMSEEQQVSSVVLYNNENIFEVL
jgi:hypothetical protein